MEAKCKLKNVIFQRESKGPGNLYTKEMNSGLDKKEDVKLK